MIDRRLIHQPGPAQEPRIVARDVQGHPFCFTIEAGERLIDGVARGFHAHAFGSGVAELGPVALEPLAYVMPAVSPDDRHAAFYSATFRPEGLAMIEAGALTYGVRDGSPFLHCHAMWREADGERAGGHILGDETVLARTTTISAFGLDGAAFIAAHDPETNFTLFAPEACARTRPGGEKAFALRLRPNQDIGSALEAFCAARGIASATIRGGVGSLIGARFEDGAALNGFATEAFLRRGRLETDAGGTLAATLDIGLVTLDGALAGGRLKRGDNPVLMTFELVLVPD